MTMPETSSSRLSGMCEHGNTPPCRLCAEKGEKNEGAQNAAEAQEKKENELAEIEKFIDAKIEFLIGEHAEYVAEGNNGAVFKLDLNELPEDLKQELKDIGLSSEDGEKAVKILKVYSKGRGRSEFALQQRAHEIASTKKDDPRYAQVPKPWKFRDIQLSPKAAGKLGKTSNFKASDRAEVLIMDYIPGKDLATHLYREAILRNEHFTDVRTQVDHLSFDALQQTVNSAIDVRRPGGKANKGNESGTIHEILKVERENAGKLIKFLSEKTDLQVDPAIIEQFSNTLKLFHENGLVMRDAHQRNFMVAGNIGVGAGNEAPAKAFFIDFENAVETPPGLSENEIQDRYIKAADGIEGKNFIDPWTPIRQLKELTVPPKERNDEGRKERELVEASLLQAKKNIEAKLKRSPDALKPFETRLLAALAKPTINREEAFDVYERYTLDSMDEARMDGFLAVGDELIRKQPESRQAFLALIEKLMEGPDKKKKKWQVKSLSTRALIKAQKYRSVIKKSAREE